VVTRGRFFTLFIDSAGSFQRGREIGDRSAQVIVFQIEKCFDQARAGSMESQNKIAARRLLIIAQPPTSHFGCVLKISQLTAMKAWQS
jgi:hypothetical protein